MEQKKWIVREPHPSDTRAKSLALTAKGARIAQNALERVDEAERSFFFSLGENARDFEAGLDRIISRQGRL